MNANEQQPKSTRSPTTEEQRDPNQLYRWNGGEYVPVEISDVAKVPVTDEALDVVKEVRKAVQKVMKTRPDLVIVASAMLLLASRQEGLVEMVKKYGAHVYSK